MHLQNASTYLLVFLKKFFNYSKDLLTEVISDNSFLFII